MFSAKIFFYFFLFFPPFFCKLRIITVLQQKGTKLLTRKLEHYVVHNNSHHIDYKLRYMFMTSPRFYCLVVRAFNKNIKIKLLNISNLLDLVGCKLLADRGFWWGRPEVYLMIQSLSCKLFTGFCKPLMTFIDICRDIYLTFSDICRDICLTFCIFACLSGLVNYRNFLPCPWNWNSLLPCRWKSQKLCYRTVYKCNKDLPISIVHTFFFKCLSYIWFIFMIEFFIIVSNQEANGERCWWSWENFSFHKVEDWRTG